MTSHHRAREKELELLISYASDAFTNKMVLNSGWRYGSQRHEKARSLWKDQITESFNLACVTLNHSMNPNFHSIDLI